MRKFILQSLNLPQLHNHQTIFIFTVLEAHPAAVAFCEEIDIPMERRIRKKTRLPGEETADIGLTVQQEMRMEHLEVMDRLRAGISRRTQELRNHRIHFDFLKAAYFLDVNNDSAMKENVNCVTNT